VIGLGMLLGFPSGLIFENCKQTIIKVISGIVCLVTIVCLCIFGLGWVAFQQPTSKYEYTVSIDESKVKLLDFNEKYEIVRQEGELWIIRDK
jgi:hypothetical protein